MLISLNKSLHIARRIFPSTHYHFFLNLWTGKLLKRRKLAQHVLIDPPKVAKLTYKERFFAVTIANHVTNQIRRVISVLLTISNY